MLLNDPQIKEKIAEWQQELHLLMGDNSYMIILAENPEILTDPQIIARIIMDDVGVSEGELKTKGRGRSVVLCRQLISYYLRIKCRLKYSEIIKYAGVSDHTSIIHSVNKIKGFIDIGDELVCKSIIRINETLKQQSLVE